MDQKEHRELAQGRRGACSENLLRAHERTSQRTCSANLLRETCSDNLRRDLSQRRLLKSSVVDVQKLRAFSTFLTCLREWIGESAGEVETCTFRSSRNRGGGQKLKVLRNAKCTFAAPARNIATFKCKSSTRSALLQLQREN